jgi:glycosyltransferase involved in cell wall biosynthesis
MARICMLAFTHYRNDARVRREAEALAGRGDEVECICLSEPSGTAGPREGGVRVFGIPVGRYRGHSMLGYASNYVIFFILASLLLTFRNFGKRYDVIQVHTMPDFLVFAAIVPRLFGAKIILDVHDLMPELFMSKFGVGETNLLVRFVTLIERLSIGFAHRAIAVQIPHRDTLIRHGNPPGKFIILMNVPDQSIFRADRRRERVPDGRFRLLYHGTIARRHGLETAIRALLLIRGPIPDVELLILGRGDDRDRLVQMVKDLGLEPQVRFSEGEVPLHSIPEYIAQADIGITPMLLDVFSRNTLPVKMLEYVEMDIPVVSSRIESFLFYFDESMVRYFEPGDEADFARVVIALHDSPAEMKSLVAHAAAFKSMYSWDLQKKDYFDLVDSLVVKKS